MPGIGILARDTVDLAKRAHRLKILTLTCLCAAWPLAASPEAAKPAERLAVSQSAPLDERDPLVLWFKEQDRLLDDILARLARIELLVREIHRLISQIPERAQAPAAPPITQPSPPPVLPPPVAAPAPAPVPVATPPVVPVPAPAVAPPPTAKAPSAAPASEAKKPRRAPPPEEEESPPAGIEAVLAEHAALLGGAAVTLLLLFWLTRRHAAPTTGRQGPPAGSKPAAVEPVAAATPVPAASPKPEPEETTISLPPSSLDIGSGQADQALELADIMLSMGLGHGAAQTLTEQIRSEPKQALRHWLKLLEIYRTNGQQAEFERSAEELRLHFNVKPEDWKVQHGAQQGIENYPHIAARISTLWPTAECLAYLENLLADNRGGARSGFPQAVAEEFLLLEGMLRYELTS
jgi:hypothetical protein